MTIIANENVRRGKNENLNKKKIDTKSVGKLAMGPWGQEVKAGNLDHLLPSGSFPKNKTKSPEMK